MTWPQIGEYTENGTVIKVYKPGVAELMPKWGSGFFQNHGKEKKRIYRTDRRQENPTDNHILKELRF